jgi:hypothetical protein
MILVKTKNTIRCIFEGSNIQYMEWYGYSKDLAIEGRAYEAEVPSHEIVLTRCEIHFTQFMDGISICWRIHNQIYYIVIEKHLP